MKAFDISNIEPTKYLFFTGKGGVGKTSIACATVGNIGGKLMNK
jgi:arsenite-transporting ATPase